MRQSPIYLTLALATLAGQAHGSSDDAWAAHDQAVVEQCQQASQFADAAPAGDPVLFDDEAGMTALLIQGHYPQNHMNSQAGQELCLYQRSSQKVYITDADKLAVGSDALPSTPTDALESDAATDEGADQPADSEKTSQKDSTP